MFSGDPEPPPHCAAVVGGAAGERAWAAPHLVKRIGAQRKTILVSALSDANKTEDNAASRDKPPRIAGCRNGHLGRGTRYRLGEVLWGFFPLAEEEAGTDGGDDVVFPFCESLKLAANSAASARTYPRDVVRKYNGPADLQSGAWRYWVGIARGACCARQLFGDLNDSSASRIGWPSYWTSFSRATPPSSR